LELYGGSAQRSCTAVAMHNTPADPVTEIWKSLEASPPPRKFVTSHNFLKTASEVCKQNNFVPQQESTWKKYLNDTEKEQDKNPWIIESPGNSSNQHHHNYNSGMTFNYFNSSLQNLKSSYSYSSKQDFNFVPYSPDIPDTISPSLGQSTRVPRREGGSTGMPESAECRWLYEADKPRDTINVARYNREDSEKDDDEISELLLQSVEKESIFSTSSEGKEGYNYSSDE
jgi:hypothetical protein